MKIHLRCGNENTGEYYEVIDLYCTRIGVLISDSGPFFINRSGYDLLLGTGLFDFNGTEIFEGDILSWYSKKEQRKLICEWDEERAQFKFRISNSKNVTIGVHKEIIKHWKITVIGNIYQQPKKFI